MALNFDVMGNVVAGDTDSAILLARLNERVLQVKQLEKELEKKNMEEEEKRKKEEEKKKMEEEEKKKMEEEERMKAEEEERNKAKEEEERKKVEEEEKRKKEEEERKKAEEEERKKEEEERKKAKEEEEKKAKEEEEKKKEDRTNFLTEYITGKNIINYIYTIDLFKLLFVDYEVDLDGDIFDDVEVVEEIEVEKLEVVEEIEVEKPKSRRANTNLGMYFLSYVRISSYI